MGLVNARELLCMPSMIPYSYGYSYTVLDAAGKRCGNIIQIYKSGNIRKVRFRTKTVTTGDTLKVTLQTVNTSTGLPTGTLIDAEATGTVVVDAADDNVWKTVDFGGAVTIPVIQGQFVALVLEWNSYVSGNMQIATTTLMPYQATTMYNTYGITDVTASPGTWLKLTSAVMHCITLEYDDGTYAQALEFGSHYGLGAATLSSTTNPDEVGNYIKFPYPFRAVGIWVIADIDYDVTLSLLDTSNNVLANCTVYAGVRDSASVGIHYVLFDPDPSANVSIIKDTWYRVIITPGASSVGQYSVDVPSAAAMDALPLGQYCYWTQRTDGGSWSQTTTKRCLIGLIGDQLDNGAGGSGGGIWMPRARQIGV